MKKYSKKINNINFIKNPSRACDGRCVQGLGTYSP